MYNGTCWEREPLHRSEAGHVLILGVSVSYPGEHSVPSTVNCGLRRWRRLIAILLTEHRIWPDVTLNTVHYRDVVRQWLFILFNVLFVYLFLQG